MDSGDGTPDGGLPATTVDGTARARALARARAATVAPTGLVSYVSAGRLALIGSMAESSPVAARVGDTLETVIVTPPGDDAGDGATARVIRADIDEVEGHLGAFTLRAERDGAPVVVAPSPLTGGKPFDLVIDLRPEPALAHEVLPPGYFAPAATRPRSRRRSTRHPSSSASSRSPATSPTTPPSAPTARPASAAARAASTPAPAAPSARSASASRSTPIYARVRGSARARARPERSPMRIRRRTVSSRPCVRPWPPTGKPEGGRRHCCSTMRRAVPSSGPASLPARPESVVPWEVEEIGSVGMDAWLGCIAWGARVVLFVPERVPESVRRELAAQIGVTRALLESMGTRPGCSSSSRTPRRSGPSCARARSAHPPRTVRRRSRRPARSVPTSGSRSITSTNTHGCVPPSPTFRPTRRSEPSPPTATPVPCAWHACPSVPHRRFRPAATSRASRSSR